LYSFHAQKRSQEAWIRDSPPSGGRKRGLAEPRSQNPARGEKTTGLRRPGAKIAPKRPVENPWRGAGRALPERRHEWPIGHPTRARPGGAAPRGQGNPRFGACPAEPRSQAGLETHGGRSSPWRSPQGAARGGLAVAPRCLGREGGAKADVRGARRARHEPPREGRGRRGRPPGRAWNVPARAGRRGRPSCP